MILAFTSARILGMLAEAERRSAEIEETLTQAADHAASIDVPLQAAVQEQALVKQTLQNHARTVQQCAWMLAQNQEARAFLGQTLPLLKQRAETLRLALKQNSGPEQAQIRRNHAACLIQLEDKQLMIKQHTSQEDALRAHLAHAQKAHQDTQDALRRLEAEIDALQGQLPPPQLYLHLFSARLARAHCRFHLDRSVEAWRRSVEEAVAALVDMYEAWRAGRYRADPLGEYLGDRDPLTVEALYGAVALGDMAQARRLFEAARALRSVSHSIFPAFRMACMGLYLEGSVEDLSTLVDMHRYTHGIYRIYALVFESLLKRDGAQWAWGIQALARSEGAVWDKAFGGGCEGMGTVSLGSLALCRLAADRGLVWPSLGPAVPQELLTWMAPFA